MLILLVVSLQLAAGAYGPISEVRTTQTTSDRLTPQATINWATDATGDQTVTVDPSQIYQSIFGFGGALTEAATSTIALLTKDLQNQILEAYYGKTGHQYTVGRVPMNSCDFSIASYSFDNTSGDYNLNNFDTKVTHDTQTMIPFITQAISTAASRGAKLNLFLTPWSPPGWMKGNGQMDGSSSPGLVQQANTFTAWAKYFTKFVDAYASYGIKFWGVTIQNEPEYAAPYEACVYNPSQEGNFLKQYLGPELRNTHPELEIMIFDHNKGDAENWADTIFGDPAASNFTQGIAVHWYDGDHFDALNNIHQKYPGKFILPTEACECPPSANNWGYGEAYGHDIMGDLNNWAVGWTDWNIVLNEQGGPNHANNFCDAPVMADTSKQTLRYQPSYYYMGHFSRYLPPNSVRIGHTVSGELEAISFSTPSGQVVVIALNRSGGTVNWKLVMKNTGQAARIVLPAHSIQTLYFQ